MTTIIKDNKKERIIIVGIGNKLMGDDGFGPYVVKLLENTTLPTKVEIRDFGTAGITVAKDLEGYDRVIFIDSMKRGESPGTIYYETLIADEIEPIKPDQELVRLSLHEAKLEELLMFAKAIGTLPPKITVIGCEPKALEPCIGLSSEVKGAVQKVLDLIVDELGKII
ncbi:MAG: hydrogenase maturation protease [Nitrososphaerales archaeon]